MKISTKIAVVGASLALVLLGASSASAYPILHVYHPGHHGFFPGPWGFGYGPGWGYGYGPGWGHGPWYWGHHWGHHHW
jgi:hypothetical protein